MAAVLEEKFRSAAELLPDDAVSVYRDIALGHNAGTDADSIKIREQAIQKLADLYASKANAGALRSLLTDLRPLFAVIPKAKTAKIVRTIIETISKVPDSTELQVRTPTVALLLVAIITYGECLMQVCKLSVCSWRSARNRWSGPDQKSGHFCDKGLKPGLPTYIWRPRTFLLRLLSLAGSLPRYFF